MIIGSLLLILLAVTLLIAGLANGSSILLISSIAASLLAAVALVAGARQAAVARADADSLGARVPGGESSPTRRRSTRVGEEREWSRTARVPTQQSWAAPVDDLAGWPDDDDDPPDEPPAQDLADDEAARLARMDAQVLVVDGRPRFHLSDCPHLRGRQTEPLAVREAVELGFSPCAGCAPATALLAVGRQS